jgi:lipoprotein signal peptidase
MPERIEHDPTLAEPAEAIHLPDPSYMPATLAFGIALSLVGILTGIIVSIIGLIIVVVVLVLWIRSTREHMAELPLEHH